MQPHQLLLLRIVLTNNKPHPPGPCGWRELKNDVVESHIRLHLHSPRLSLLLILKSPAHPFPFAIQDSAVLLCSSPPPPHRATTSLVPTITTSNLPTPSPPPCPSRRRPPPPPPPPLPNNPRPPPVSFEPTCRCTAATDTQVQMCTQQSPQHKKKQQ